MKCFRKHTSRFRDIIYIKIQLKMFDNLSIKKIVSIRICSDFYDVIKRVQSESAKIRTLTILLNLFNIIFGVLF